MRAPLCFIVFLFFLLVSFDLISFIYFVIMTRQNGCVFSPFLLQTVRGLNRRRLQLQYKQKQVTQINNPSPQKKIKKGKKGKEKKGGGKKN